MPILLWKCAKRYYFAIQFTYLCLPCLNLKNLVCEAVKLTYIAQGRDKYILL